MSAISRALISAVSLGGVTVGGAGIYKLTSTSTEEQKIQTEKRPHKHAGIFNKLSKDYRSRAFLGANGRTVKIEMIDPNDPWWNTKWEEYKSQSIVFPKTKKEEASASLEGFQEICFEEIQKFGPNFSDTAQYAEVSGKLKKVGSDGPVSESEIEERKFSWEYCIRVTVS